VQAQVVEAALEVEQFDEGLANLENEPGPLVIGAVVEVVVVLPLIKYPGPLIVFGWGHR